MLATDRDEGGWEGGEEKHHGTGGSRQKEISKKEKSEKGKAARK